MKRLIVIDIAGTHHVFTGKALTANDHATPSLYLSIYDGDRKIAQFSQFIAWKEESTES